MTTTHGMSPADARNLLAPAPDDKLFYCVNGEVYRTLQDLHEGLQHMQNEHFAYHCNDVKQDFSAWVRDVIGDARLADDLRQRRTSADAAEAVREEIERAHAAEARPALTHAGHRRR